MCPRWPGYTGFANEPVDEPIPDYHDMLEEVRAAFVAMDGVQPGDPRRGARAVIAAMAQDPPPRRLVLGNSGYDAVIDTLEQTIADLRANENPSRSADFPACEPTERDTHDPGAIQLGHPSRSQPRRQALEQPNRRLPASMLRTTRDPAD